ncbi:MAG: FAD-dependent oxidoreductase, partial [Actinomycetota bacterium]|nr:FAD-dependent oxidoreductase [Actinomycetota bacterium]
MARKEQPGSADYVVVGAGSSGCAVAARLAESGASVILVEAGGPDKSIMVTKPGMIGPMHADPKLKSRFDWGYYTAPQEHLLGRKMPTTRGKVMGGSSSINGMVYVRGNRQNYDDWAAEGCTGWSYDEVLVSLKKLESWEDGGSAYRGGDGPIKVTRRSDGVEPTAQFREAAAETFGVPVLEDYNAESQEGLSIFQQSASGGRRYSASRGYVTDLHPPSLHVRTGGAVSRVVVENGRATGVELVDTKGQRHVVRAEKEVVLSAGVFGSAQILMLSGIGPAEHLRELGIDVLSDLPVGENLHDHLFVPTTWLMPTARHKGSPAY